jgi:hypothetical protein
MTLNGPARWSQLASLLDGYLHQDFAAEHGTAAGAVQAWLDTASAADVMAVSSEWRSFLNVTAGMDVDRRGRALRAMGGGAWDPRSPAEFEAVSTLLLDGWRRR